MKEKCLALLLAGLALTVLAGCDSLFNYPLKDATEEALQEESSQYVEKSGEAMDDSDAQTEPGSEEELVPDTEIQESPVPQTPLPGPLPEGEQDGQSDADALPQTSNPAEHDFSASIALLEDTTGTRCERYLLGTVIPTYVWDGQTFFEQVEVQNYPIYGDGKVVGMHVAMADGASSFGPDSSLNPAIEAGVTEYCLIIYGGKTFIFGNGKIMMTAEIHDDHGAAMAVPGLTVNDLVQSIIDQNPSFLYNTDLTVLEAGVLRDITPQR